MAQRVVLHVGTPKSGTTFVQSVLWSNRDRLRADGVLLPGKQPYDHNVAATAVRTWKPDGNDRPRERREQRRWHRCVEEATAWPGTVVLSNEWLGMADVEQARHAVADLGPARVEVVLTARDAVAQAPAAWQESLKLGHGTSFRDFLVALDAPTDRWTWRHLDAAEVLSTWSRAVPASACSVVTVPPAGSDPSVLWSRFARVVGVEPTGYDVGGRTSNQSLSAEAAAVLQQIGPSLRAAIDVGSGRRMEQYRWIRQYVGHELLLAVPGRPIGLRAIDVTKLRARSDQTVTRLAQTGYQVVGDLADLSSTTVSPRAVLPDDVTDSEKLEVALALLPRLLARVREEASAARPSQD